MKRTLGSLAVLGGAPAFDTPVVFGRPNIGSRKAFYDRLDKVLDSRWLSNGGVLCEEFERRVAQAAGTPYCIATCNATCALQLALRARGVTGEVIMPAFTFAATAHALSWIGLTPVLCDVDPDDGSLLLSEAEALIGPDTTAILGVHIWGRPSRLDELTSLAQRHALALIFDSAHAFGCGWNGRRIGGFGDAEVFSFHATKFINSFEGGALVTADGELARRARQMRNFGIARHDDVVSVGTNAKLHEASAAMGLTSLDDMDHFVRSNRENYRRYRDELAGTPGLRLLEVDEREASNYQYVVLDVDAARTGLDRDDLLAVLAAENVFARRYFYPGCHRMDPYRTHRPFPGTDSIAARVMVLPTGECVTADDITAVCAIIRLAVERGHEVTRCLRRAA
ncbi:DegT/DnrJ/EryC1/StrS family aminotransferase [Streptomyces sp. NPDC007971]|uniref:DegT/DnrJ/EryC1/StrS family aminotransferase n=1 Tax=Streptomyces sp. NPDC007971 TaxID=3364799 RepID=UPI0036F0A7A1